MWALSLGGAWSWGIIKIGQMVLARVMETQIWRPAARLERAGLNKGTTASASSFVWEKSATAALSPEPDNRFLQCVSGVYLHSTSPCTPSSSPRAGAQSEWVHQQESPCVGPLSGKLGLQPPSLSHSLHWLSRPEFMGTSLPGTKTLGWGSRCGTGLLAPQWGPLQLEMSLLNLSHLSHLSLHGLFLISCYTSSVGSQTTAGYTVRTNV